MISKSFEKYINSLKHKKHREERQRFIAEGEKIVSEFLKEGWGIEKIIPTIGWCEKNKDLAQKYKDSLLEVSEQDMKRISSLVTPSPVMLVGEIPQWNFDPQQIGSQLNLALDTIQDPGNLGTIIRIADWFGIQHVFCSENCADAFNPKTIMASMGSLARVKVMETNLAQLFERFNKLPVFGTFTEGENLFEMQPPTTGFIVIGNEAYGISGRLVNFIQKRITIKRIGKAESLNAAVAAGIVCAWMKR
jgi:TrmH family RNA methyltransferase